jgi:prefoldin subunit 5
MKSYEFKDKDAMAANNKSIKEPIPVVDEEIGKNCLCSEKFFDRKIITSCLLSAAIAGICVFGALRVTMHSLNEEIKTISQNSENSKRKLQEVTQQVDSINKSLATFEKDLKSSREDIAYMYSKMASVQNSISSIKNEFHITEKSSIKDMDLKNLSAEQISFIEAFESLINEGAPFMEFIKSNEDKIDITKYESGKELKEFADQKVSSVSDLQKEFLNVGQSEFDISLNETFWEKQKRIIKEKIVNSVKIKNADDDSSKNVVSEDGAWDDRLIFTEAAEHMKAGRVEDALSTLEKIKQYHPDLNKFIKNAEQRVALTKVFGEFKKEFIENAPPKKSDKKEDEVKTSAKNSAED